MIAQQSFGDGLVHDDIDTKTYIHIFMYIHMYIYKHIHPKLDGSDVDAQEQAHKPICFNVLGSNHGNSCSTSEIREVNLGET